MGVYKCWLELVGKTLNVSVVPTLLKVYKFVRGAIRSFTSLVHHPLTGSMVTTTPQRAEHFTEHG